MDPIQRRIELFNILQADGSVEVNKMAALFNVSPVTIRRDLTLFERQQLVTTNYGGAYLNKGSGIEPSFALKQGQMSEQKQFIARAAADMIQNGDTVMLDCGTTTLAILKYIQNKQLTIITNSWPAIGYVQGSPNVKLILAPGEYSELSAGTVSSATIEFFANLRADIAFVSTQGFDPLYGATVPDLTDAGVKQALTRCGNKKILTADSSKIGKVYFARHASPGDFDAVITDSRVGDEQLQLMRAHCRQVVIA